MNPTKATPVKERLIGKARLFAAGLAGALALTLAAATVAVSPQLEAASAQNRQGEASLGAGQQRLVGEVFSRTELYFGSDKPGPDVTRKQFDRFVDKKVTPRFPDGLTQLTGYGQFRGSSGEIVQEKSFVLILLYPTDDKQANGEIQELRKEYKSDFKQESVLRVDSRERVSF